jgi:hypothetical protein
MDVENTFIPGRIDRCPECDSEKIVFPESRSRKRKNESGGINLDAFFQRLP